MWKGLQPGHGLHVRDVPRRLRGTCLAYLMKNGGVTIVNEFVRDVDSYAPYGSP